MVLPQQKPMQSPMYRGTALAKADSRTLPRRQGSKRRPDSHRNLGKARLVLYVFVVIALALGLIYRHAQIAQLSHGLNHLKEQVAVAEESKQRLQLQVASLSSLDRIARIATEELGMVMPTEYRVVYASSSLAGGEYNVDQAEALSADTDIANTDGVLAFLSSLVTRIFGGRIVEAGRVR